MISAAADAVEEQDAAGTGPAVLSKGAPTIRLIPIPDDRRAEPRAGLRMRVRDGEKQAAEQRPVGSPWNTSTSPVPPSLPGAPIKKIRIGRADRCAELRRDAPRRGRRIVRVASSSPKVSLSGLASYR